MPYELDIESNTMCHRFNVIGYDQTTKLSAAQKVGWNYRNIWKFKLSPKALSEGVGMYLKFDAFGRFHTHGSRTCDSIDNYKIDQCLGSHCAPRK